MRPSRVLMLATATLAVISVACGNQDDAGNKSTPSKAMYYLSLGDSAAAGFQPPGSHNSQTHGYADQLYDLVRSEFSELRLVKLGCSGETAESLISGKHSPCPRPSGSQLDRATSFLEKHAGHVAFITLDIGGNDAVGACLADTGELGLACVRTTMPDIQANLAHIIETLQRAAPDVPIAGMSYWNPFLGAWIDGHDGQTLARTDEKAFEAFNAGLVSTYRKGGALVADVAGPDSFNIADFTDMVTTKKWGKVPVNVANTCGWTWFCTDPPVGPDIHPNTGGYGVIAKAFEAVLSSSIR